jgi:hypothetical protein
MLLTKSFFFIVVVFHYHVWVVYVVFFVAQLIQLKNSYNFIGPVNYMKDV